MALPPAFLHLSSQRRFADLPGAKNRHYRELLEQSFHAVQVECAAKHA
jgi:hypothetical protein